MKVNLGDDFKFDVFELEQAKDAEQIAVETNGLIYSWKTIGKSNWLEKGFSLADVLGITILPKDSPEWIDLLDDKK